MTSVNNNYAVGSTLLFNAVSLVRGDMAHCALTLGFQCIAAGALGAGKNDAWHDRPSPIGPLMHAAMACASPDADLGSLLIPRYMILYCARTNYSADDSRSKMVEADVLAHLVGLLQDSGRGAHWPSIEVITTLVEIGRSIYHFVLYKG
jgi:hypothetical protein